MTRKHFIALAAALAASRPDESIDPSVTNWELVQWVADVAAIAEVCAASNPAFNWERFLAATEEGS